MAKISNTNQLSFKFHPEVRALKLRHLERERRARARNPLPPSDRIFLGREAQPLKVYPNILYEVVAGLDAKADDLIYRAHEKARLAFAG